MSCRDIIRDKLQSALGAMSQADKSTPAAQFIEGIERAHLLGFHVVVYKTDAGQLVVSLLRNEHQHWLKASA